MMQQLLKIIFGVLAVGFGLLVGGAVALVFAGLIMYVFNATVAGYAGLPPVTFWQAFGLMWVCNALFGSRTST